jgi:hypothetical protein
MNPGAPSRHRDCRRIRRLRRLLAVAALTPALAFAATGPVVVERHCSPTGHAVEVERSSSMRTRRGHGPVRSIRSERSTVRRAGDGARVPRELWPTPGRTTYQGVDANGQPFVVTTPERDCRPRR